MVELKAHPAANLFPLMGTAELQALADDIRTNGQKVPVAVTLYQNGSVEPERRILDGRNRYAACAIAKVDPIIEEVEVDDPVAFVVSLNVKRRNLTAGQKAIAAAEASILYARFSNADRKRIAKDFGVAENYVQQARALVERDPVSAAAVKAGTANLDTTYDALITAEREALRAASSLDALREQHPDLADMVASESLSLTEAWAAAKEREGEAKRQRDIRTTILVDLATVPPTDHAETYFNDYDPSFDPAGKVSPEALRAAASFCVAVALLLEEETE